MDCGSVQPTACEVRTNGLATREQENDRRAHFPRWSGVGMCSESAEPDLIARWKCAKGCQLREEQVNGNRPSAFVDLPVGSAFRLKGHGQRACGLIGEKGLEEHLIHILTVRIAGKRPDLIPQRSIRPMPTLLEGDHGRPGTPLLRTQSWNGRRRQTDGRSRAPYQSALRRRKEERRENVADTGLGYALLHQRRLADNRDDDARDQ